MNQHQHRINKSIINSFALPASLMLGGIVLAVTTGMRWSAPFTAWIYLVPFMLYIRLGYKKLPLLPVLVLALTAQVLKIASEPLYVFMALISGLQIGILYWGALLFTDKIRSSRGESPAILFFASLITVIEYLSALISPLGYWGMFANTQLEQLATLQLASITGAFGISFLMAWATGFTESIIASWLIRSVVPGRAVLAQTLAFTLVMTLAQVWGAIRLDSRQEGRQVAVAAVSAKKYGLREVLNYDYKRRANNEEVYDLIMSAAERQARIIVTNEGAMAITPGEESPMIDRIKSISREKKVHIIAGYVILRGEGKKMLNKLVWSAPGGGTSMTYYKQFLPPGEPSEKIEQSPLLFKTDFGRASAAICYDFDSPGITAFHGKSGSGIVFLPSSDWRGIDPIHTQMARLRAIEQGYSVVRSSRASMSAAYDAYGRTRGMLPWHEENDGIMIATVPVRPVGTPYKALGDWFAWINMVFIASFLAPFRKKIPVTVQV